MGSIEAYIHVGIIIEASIHKGKDAQKHVHKGINSSKGILWNFICLDLKWVRPEKRFIKIYWLMDWYLFGYDLQFLFPCFQHVESFVDFLCEISIIIQHPCQLAILLLQQHASELSSLDSDHSCSKFQVGRSHLSMSSEHSQSGPQQTWSEGHFSVFCHYIQVSDTLS